LNEDLISKKELLEITGISYGQLYRWKRKNLIPEEWFVRKSTFTGQETFFPKTRVIERIEKIKNMKENLSLDDLANMLSPNLTEAVLTGDMIKESNLVSDMTLDFYRNEHGETEKFTFEEIIFLYILDKMFKSGKISSEEGKIILKLLKDHYSRFKGKNCQLIFFRKLGVSSCCLVSQNDIYFDDNVKIIENLNVSELIEEVKIKMV
jgi:hypothetical protein